KKQRGVFFYGFWGVVSLFGTFVILGAVVLLLVGTGAAVSEAAKQPGVRRGEIERRPLSIAPNPASITPDEKRLIEVFPEIVWNKSDLLARGWAKPGQNVRLKYG